MKKINRSNIKKFVVMFMLPMIFTFSCVFAVKCIPKDVLYSVNIEKTSTKQDLDLYKIEENEYMYDDLYLIPDGEYIIRTKGKDVVVFSQNSEKIYLVKTNNESFSLSDQKELSGGIYISNREDLFEIVEYLES